jgi:hypothetical protein
MTDHYVIQTCDGWAPLLPPMAPAPPMPRWGHFAGAAAYDALFVGGDGQDMRITGNWYHLRDKQVRPDRRTRR